MSQTGKGVKELIEEVIDQGLCTGCGACLTGCPYLANHDGRIVMIDKCIGNDGDCYMHCPRTFLDMDRVSKAVFGNLYDDGEIGHFLEIFMARSKNSEFMEKGQDGGTVSSLLVMAIEEGLIDVVACTQMNEEKNRMVIWLEVARNCSSALAQVMKLALHWKHIVAFPRTV